jgi:hypothetical protein
MPEKDDAVVTLLASWLLVHELADDWIRDAVSRGRAPEADPVASLAAEVDEKKARMKEALATDIGATEAPGAFAELGESIAALGRRLESIEARLDGLSERK